MTLDSHSYQPAHRPHLTNCFPAATGTGGGGCSELCTLKMLRVEWTAVLVAVLALVAGPPPVRTAEVNCTSHTAPVLRDIVVLGQFNFPKRLPLRTVMRWVTSWRCLSRQVVVAGPFSGAKLAALQKEVPVLQTAPDRGWVSPYGALARALEMFRHDEAFHGVLYVHDDLLLNNTLLLSLPFDPRQPLFSMQTPRRSAFSSPRHAFEWEGGVADAGHHWWKHPDVGIPKLRAAWADPRARRFQAADGSFSWWIGQSDMAYVPMRVGGDYIAAAAWLGAHGVFLEIALPSIMMWLEDARGARVQQVDLCTRFHSKCRNLGRNCTADLAAFCRGLGTPFGAIHAIKPSKHLPDWEALFDGITLADTRHAACCRVLRNAVRPAAAAAPRPPEPPAAPPSPPKPRPRNALHSLLPPSQVVKQYQQWHSQGSLERAPDNRAFAIGYYSCPREAGGRLHRFFNDLIFAMATNRTLLWKYQDDKFVENTPEDCEQVLGRGAWLPSYAVWAPRLSLGPAVHLHRDKPVPLDATKSRVVALPDIRHPWPPFITGNGLRTSPARERSRSLFAEGRWFLYGLLFRETFRFQPAVLPPPPPPPPAPRPREARLRTGLQHRAALAPLRCGQRRVQRDARTRLPRPAACSASSARAVPRLCHGGPGGYAAAPPCVPNVPWVRSCGRVSHHRSQLQGQRPIQRGTVHSGPGLRLPGPARAGAEREKQWILLAERDCGVRSGDGGVAHRALSSAAAASVRHPHTPRVEAMTGTTAEG